MVFYELYATHTFCISIPILIILSPNVIFLFIFGLEISENMEYHYFLNIIIYLRKTGPIKNF